MGVKQGKKWGETEALLENEQIQVHRITFEEGKECSQHKHAARYNAFFVIEGMLRLHVWRGAAKKADQLDMVPGDFATVAPGEQHCFEALSDGQALEIYYPAPIRADDIVRFT